MNMSHTRYAVKGGDLGNIIPPFLTVHRKRKRHIRKKREGKSVRQNVRKRG
jgi:hypothetical protein